MTSALLTIFLRVFSDVNPDYVVVGETRSYDYEKLERAARLVRNGSRLIGTNIDIVDPSERVSPKSTVSLAEIILFIFFSNYANFFWLSYDCQLEYTVFCQMLPLIRIQYQCNE